MPTDPYATPKAASTDERLPGGPVKAVLVGLAIDVGGSIVLSTVLAITYGVMLARSGMTAEQIAQAIATPEPTSFLSILGYVLGCALSILGGFVCARIARRRDYKLGAILGAISAVLGLAMAYGQYSLIENLGLTALTFASVMLGTRLGMPKA
jgi:hypothetical protein